MGSPPLSYDSAPLPVREDLIAARKGKVAPTPNAGASELGIEHFAAQE